MPRAEVLAKAEVIRMLLQILPVWSTSNFDEMIHRVSPNNLILRSSGHLPVLIDWSVKQVACRRLADLTSQLLVHPLNNFAPADYAPRERSPWAWWIHTAICML